MVPFGISRRICSSRGVAEVLVTTVLEMYGLLITN